MLDEIGESAHAFNQLVDALAGSMRTHFAARSFAEILASELGIERLAEQALGQFFEHAGASGGLILYESGGEFELAASRGLRDPQAVMASDHVDSAVRTGERRVLTIPDHVRVEVVVTDFRPQEVMVIPITYKTAPLGAVVLATATTFDANHRARIDLFLPGLGLALNNALAHDRLQRLAALDPLTGVYNRRFGLGRLHEEFSRAVRMNTPLGILLMDIDHFKTVNGERLRRTVEDATITDRDRSIRVTLSVGGAAYPRHDVEKDDALIQLADDALYRAKAAGRNRVEVAR